MYVENSLRAKRGHTLPLPFQVRNESYHKCKLEGLSKKQLDVLNALSFLGRATQKETADYLGFEINRVTGRFNELMKKKLIVPVTTTITKESNRRRTVFELSREGILKINQIINGGVSE